MWKGEEGSLVPRTSHFIIIGRPEIMRINSFFPSSYTYHFQVIRRQEIMRINSFFLASYMYIIIKE